MSNIAISVENISKQYRLGELSTGTISHDLNRWWAKMRGKEDPFLKVGESNDRTSKGTSDYVWSLKDVSFEINQGDAVGIIGRNGAGKSTLLKLLSKVTSPTTGVIKTKGRIASLLEVGTGFHPELTGRENIFLNGAILGMTKAEIRRKFDEIVDFAGVERYIDTPVKRYSSGMYVRLAFAVAAHLESEILIIDEVLAVGDAEFQKKCLGKMGDISSGEGRTVLFVSHNMQAISSFCKTGVVLDKGTVYSVGKVENSIQDYMNLMKSFRFDANSASSDRNNRTSGKAKINNLVCLNNNKLENKYWSFREDEEIIFSVSCITKEICDGFSFYIAFSEPMSNTIITNLKNTISSLFINTNTTIDFNVTIPKNTFRSGQYEVYFAIGNGASNEWHDVVDQNVNLPSLIILPTNEFEEMYGYFNIKYKVDETIIKEVN